MTYAMDMGGPIRGVYDAGSVKSLATANRGWTAYEVCGAQYLDHRLIIYHVHRVQMMTMMRLLTMLLSTHCSYPSGVGKGGLRRYRDD